MLKWLMFGVICLACVLGVGLLLFGLPPKEETAPERTKVTVPVRPVDVAAAEEIYKQNCLSCHGDQLQGAFAPELNKIGASMSIEQIYNRIVNGGGGMPKFEGRLTEDEIVNITNWLAAKK